MNLPRQLPTLEGLSIPDALKTAIRRLYQLLYDLRDDTLAKFAALPVAAPQIKTFYAILTPTDTTHFLSVPEGGTMTAWSILVDAGTATVKTWKVPAGTAVPTASNSISTAGVAITVGTAVRSDTLTDFTTTTIADNDILAAFLSASAGAARIVFQLEWR